MMTLNVVRKTLGLSLVAGLLLTVSWVGNAQGIEWGRRSSVTYSRAASARCRWLSMMRLIL